jgi:hypothetical protein
MENKTGDEEGDYAEAAETAEGEELHREHCGTAQRARRLSGLEEANCE